MVIAFEKWHTWCRTRNRRRAPIILYRTIFQDVSRHTNTQASVCLCHLISANTLRHVRRKADPDFGFCTLRLEDSLQEGDSAPDCVHLFLGALLRLHSSHFDSLAVLGLQRGQNHSGRYYWEKLLLPARNVSCESICADRLLTGRNLQLL